jgi:hypothetical protein
MEEIRDVKIVFEGTLQIARSGVKIIKAALLMHTLNTSKRILK